MMTEITKTDDQKLKTKNRFIWLLFALLIVFTYFFGLTMPLVGPDEPRYAQIAREMFERGDWITPTLGGFDWFEKPALLYWLEIASYKLFGVNEFAARFGSAIFGLGTIFCLWILGKSIPNPESEIANPESEIWHLEFADWLALIGASSVGLIAFSRGASFDIILTFPITAALVAFFIFDQSKTRSLATYHLPLTTFYFFIGVALIGKGLIGIVFPFAIVAFYYLLSWRLPSKTFLLSLIWGTILSLLVAAVWYLPMYQANGWKFIDEFFIQHHFQRFTSDKYQHHQPFWFFFLVLPLMTIPWLPFFLASLWDFFKVQGSRFGTDKPALGIFAFAWLLVPLVFFSLSGSKLPGYILPALPAAAVLTAIYVYKFVRQSALRKFLLQISAFLVFVVTILLLEFAAPYYAAQDSVKGLIEVAGIYGFKSEKIVNLYTISHNLEFYAPERIVRNSDGTQKRYDDFAVLANEVKNSQTGSILVLVPRKDMANVMFENPTVEAQLLGGNEELLIVALKAK